VRLASARLVNQCSLRHSSQAADEALGEGVLDGLARLDDVPIDAIFDVPAGATMTDPASDEVVRTSTSHERVGFHIDFMFDGHRWRADHVAPIGADYRRWAVLPQSLPLGPRCTAFSRDVDDAVFDERPDRQWCDADGRGRGIQEEQLVMLTRYPCDRGQAAILHIGRPLGAPTDPLVRWEYVRDPAGEFLALRWLTEPYAGDSTLPDDAAYTDWTNGNIELWISPSELDRAVYVVRGETIERWPRASEQWGVTDCN
jgi:hypothetical protein